MDSASRRYRAVFFDLDGTLLMIDMHRYLSEYFARLEECADAAGFDGGLFMRSLSAGIRAVVRHDNDLSNREAFWRDFMECYRGGHTLQEFMDFSDSFYDGPFGEIMDPSVANPSAARACSTLVEKGYPLILTTMPLYPMRAVEQRLCWAGISPDIFARISSYDNSGSLKPKDTYFAENLFAAGLQGKDVLMVGNNTMEDLSILGLGADAYLVTDCLLDPISFDISSIMHGSLDDFADWVEELPACEHPAFAIKGGCISRGDTMRCLAQDIDGDVLIARKRKCDGYLDRAFLQRN